MESAPLALVDVHHSAVLSGVVGQRLSALETHEVQHAGAALLQHVIDRQSSVEQVLLKYQSRLGGWVSRSDIVPRRPDAARVHADHVLAQTASQLVHRQRAFVHRRRRGRHRLVQNHRAVFSERAQAVQVRCWTWKTTPPFNSKPLNFREPFYIAVFSVETYLLPLNFAL